jgi:Tfp pilus assembly protein PilX
VRTERPADPGFILATTLLVMTLLTVMLTAGFVMISAEFRSTNGSFSLSRSLNLAQSGLHSYFASAHALGTGYDSTNYAFPGGYARVVARRLQDSTGSQRPIWIVYSTGVDSTRSLTNTGGGRRTVASLAYLPGQMPARAAIIAPNGITMVAGSSTNNPIFGRNSEIGANWVLGCTTPANPSDDTAAISMAAPYVPGTGNAPVGTVQTLAPATAVTDSTSIDWARVVAGDLYPDYTGTLPSDCSGNSSVCPYSSFYWSGNVTVPASGGSTSRRGLLVATGNVTMAKKAHWDGIIIAGGYFVLNDSSTVHGMVVSGMNCATGACPVPDSIRRFKPGDDGKTPALSWDWCYAHAAISGFASLAPIAGTFVDTWRTY